MIAKSRLIYCAGIIFLIILFGCGEKFDKAQWDEYEHLDGSDRSLMAEDLLKTSQVNRIIK